MSGGYSHVKQTGPQLPLSTENQSLISLQTTLNQFYNKVTKYILHRHAQTRSPAEKTGGRACLVCSVCCSLVHRTSQVLLGAELHVGGHTPCHPAVVLPELAARWQSDLPQRQAAPCLGKQNLLKLGPHPVAFPNTAKKQE